MSNTTEAPSIEALNAECRRELAISKLRSIAWLLSQATLELEVKDEDLHGIAAIITDCVDALGDAAPEVH